MLLFKAFAETLTSLGNPVDTWAWVNFVGRPAVPITALLTMKVSSSLKSLKKRHPNCQVVRRKGRIYVINKTHPRYKARQG